MRVVWYLCHRELQLTAQLQQKKANDRGDTAQLIIIYYKYDTTINLIIFSTNSFKNKKQKTSTQGGRTINCRRKYINQEKAYWKATYFSNTPSLKERCTRKTSFYHTINMTAMSTKIKERRMVNDGWANVQDASRQRVKKTDQKHRQRQSLTIVWLPHNMIDIFFWLASICSTV